MITEWMPLSRRKAREELEYWEHMPADEFQEMTRGWPEKLPEFLNSDYRRLRNELISAYEDAGGKTGGLSDSEEKSGRAQYRIDLGFGLKLYQILDKAGFNVRLASYDPVWIFITMKVIPDVVLNRYPSKPKDGVLNPISMDRFCMKTRRIYPKLLWWYIYLSLCFKDNGEPDYEKTRRILAGNTTDEILQIVDRAGSAGYRVDVYRYLMEYYGTHRDKYDSVMLRRVMVLHVARAQIMEPDLCAGGVSGYVQELFRYLDEQGITGSN